MTARERQRGAALLTALLVVAIATILAANLMWEANLDDRRTKAALDADQGLLLMLGAEAWAADILRQDLIDSPDTDHLGEQWAIELPPLPVEGGTIVGRIEDLEARFNLNNLITPDGEPDEISLAQFERLLQVLDLDPRIAGVALDWIDANAEQHFPSGGEDVAYAGADPPYRTANTLVTSATELLAMAGVDAETYTRLAPYVTALPVGTTINVNTASDVVLASLSDDIDIGLAASLVEERAGTDFADIDATFEGLVEPDMLQRIDGVSRHFLLTATVTLGTSQLTMRSVLQRDASGLTRPLFRSLGIQ